MKIPDDAFEYYVGLGSVRSYDAVAKHFDVSKRGVTKKATTERWSERLIAIEEKARAAIDEKLVGTITEMRERHLKTVRAIPQGEFEASYSVFEGFFGKEELGREPRPIVLATNAQKEAISRHVTDLGMSPDVVAERLTAYGAATLDELTEPSAAIILEKLEAAVASASG